MFSDLKKGDKVIVISTFSTGYTSVINCAEIAEVEKVNKKTLYVNSYLYRKDNGKNKDPYSPFKQIEIYSDDVFKKHKAKEKAYADIQKAYKLMKGVRSLNVVQARKIIEALETKGE